MNNIEKLAIECGLINKVNTGLSDDYLTKLESFAKAYAQQQSEPVGEVVIHMIGANDVCAIQWMDGYKPKVGDLLFTHPPATVPEGYALVPIEPTKEMLVDMFRAWNACDIPKGSDSFTDWRDAYKAMLSTSPTPPNAVPSMALTITALQKRVAVLEDLLSSAYNIANRNGENTHWERFAGQLYVNGISPITAKTFKILPSDTDYTPPNAAPLEKYNKLLDALNALIEAVEIHQNDDTGNRLENGLHSGENLDAQLALSKQAIAEAEEKV